MLTASLALMACGEAKNASDPYQGSGSQQNDAAAASRGIAVSEEDVSRTLEYLSSDELQGRKTGTDGIGEAANYIESVFEQNSIQPFFETYRDSFERKGTVGYNIVGIKEGSDPELKDEFIIIGAHYDHIGTGELVGDDTLANGANDNASGTTAVLELAKHFSGKETKRSMLFTLYSAEEMGLAGSSHLAARLKQEQVNPYVMFNIEMIGVPMKDKSASAYITGYHLSNLAEKFNEYAGTEVLGFLPQAEEYNLFNRSDNAPFYNEFQMPAQTISTFDFTNYKFYHHVDDEFQFMNVPHMVSLIEQIIPGLSEMANTNTREIKLNQ